MMKQKAKEEERAEQQKALEEYRLQAAREETRKYNEEMAKKLFEQMTEGESGLIKDSINDGIHGVEDYISEEYREIKDDFVSGLSPMDSQPDSQPTR